MTGDLSSKLDEILANPAMLAQIKALADTMTGHPVKQQDDPVEPPPSAPPPEAEQNPLAPLPILFTPSPTLTQNLKHTRDLLLALKPFLDEKRCGKVDKMLSMMRIAEMAGTFGTLL